MTKWIFFFTLAFSLKVCESAPFQNLGFDNASTNHLSGGYGPPDEMLPGWQYVNPLERVPGIGHNAVTAGLNFSSLYDTNISLQLGYSYPVDGKYSLGIVPGVDGNGLHGPISLIQTGDVPADAKTITFVDFGGPFELRVNGSLVPLIYLYPPVGAGSPTIPVNAYGDISAYAGQTAELTFTTIDGLDSLHGIDSISFLPQIIPEPAPSLLFGLGGFAWLLRSSFRGRRRFKR